MTTYCEREAKLRHAQALLPRLPVQRGFLRALPSLVAISSWALAASAGADNVALHNSALTGVSVVWAGATDKMSVTSGFVYINDHYIYVPGQTITTTAVGTVWDTAGTGGQQALKPYYVYEMAYNLSPVAATIVISPTPPQVEGNPASMTGITFKVAGTTYSNVTTGEFLGSYITDSGNHMVPFARLGDEVVLEYNITGTTPIPMDTATFATTDTYPSNKSLKPYIDTPNSHTYPIPHSAQAILGLVEFDTTGAAPSLAILNPLAGNPATCNVSAVLQANPTTTVPMIYPRVRIPRNFVTPEVVKVFDCAKPAPGKTDTIKISYIGYVENVNHVQN